MRYSRAKTIAAALALALLTVSMGQRALAAEATPRTHQVAIDAVSYAPETLIVNVGDTVIWTNDDLYIHTVTSKDGDFDSGNIAPGASWTLKPTEKGEFPYSCIYHKPMTGTLVVR